jgi:hypothetical protein
MIIPAVRKTILWTMAAALLGGLSLAPPGARGEGPEQRDSPQVMKLLKEARSEATRLRTETVKLESYKNGRLSLQTHGLQLEATKDHVNELGKILDKLEARKAEASPWQEKAIEGIRPLLEELAKQTTRAIAHLNQNPRQLQHPDYHDVLEDKAALASQLANLLDDQVKYGEAKAELEELESTVGRLS